MAHVADMGFDLFSKAKLFTWTRAHFQALGGPAVLGLSLSVAIGSLGLAQAAVRAATAHAPLKLAAIRLTSAPAPAQLLELAPPGPAWEGRDLDGDGAPDFANPTGGEPRGHDRFGDGYFHASRDGGAAGARGRRLR
jgi:hypothetical protein